MVGGKKVLKLLLKIFGIVFSVVLLAVSAFSLVLAKPQEASREPAGALPTVSASPALNIRDESDLYQLVAAFPAPVMSFMSGSGMAFVSATSADTAVSGGFGRVATLYWQTADGEPLILQSIYPAGALGLLEEGFHFSPRSGPTLFGKLSVRMENQESIRIHTDTDQALYVIRLPQSLSGRISELCRSLQLFTVNPRD